MKKSTFDINPELIVIEGSNVRINFDVTTENVPVSNMNGEDSEETREVFKAYVVRFPLPFDIDAIQKAVMEEGFGEKDARVVAAEVILKAIQDQLMPGNELSAAKELKTAIINAYDKSSNVDNFTLDDNNMWLDREMRRTLRERFTREENKGLTTTRLTYANTTFVLPLTLAHQMIDALEDYATACFDRTQEHLQVVAQMDSVDDILNYDHTADYPPCPAFTTPAE